MGLAYMLNHAVPISGMHASGAFMWMGDLKRQEAGAAPHNN